MTADHTSTAAEPQSVVLADAEGYRLTYHPGTKRADTLLVTFGTMLSGLSDEGFGTKFAKKRGYDHIFVAQAPDSWYQRLSLEEFEAVVAGGMTRSSHTGRRSAAMPRSTTQG